MNYVSHPICVFLTKCFDNSQRLLDSFLSEAIPCHNFLRKSMKCGRVRQSAVLEQNSKTVHKRRNTKK